MRVQLGRRFGGVASVGEELFWYGSSSRRSMDRLFPFYFFLSSCVRVLLF